MDHAPFIWTAYGITAAVLIWTALAPVLRRHRTLHTLRHAVRGRPRPETADGASR